MLRARLRWGYGVDAGGGNQVNVIGDEVRINGFVGALIDHLSEGYNIDAERVYASGYSNGGFLSYALACHHGDRESLFHYDDTCY